MEDPYEQLDASNYRRPTDYECAIMARLVYGYEQDIGQDSPIQQHRTFWQGQGWESYKKFRLFRN